jgi:hypothetical protein
MLNERGRGVGQATFLNSHLKDTIASGVWNMIRQNCRNFCLSLLCHSFAFDLMESVDDVLKAEVVKWASFYEHRIKLGSKLIFHLEAFVAKFMREFEMYLMGIHI